MTRNQQAQAIFDAAPWQRKDAGDGHRPKPNQALTVAGLEEQIGQLAALNLPPSEVVKKFTRAIQAGFRSDELGTVVRRWALEGA